MPFLIINSRTGRRLFRNGTGFETHIDSRIRKSASSGRKPPHSLRHRFAAFAMKSFSYNLSFMYITAPTAGSEPYCLLLPCKLDAAGHIFLFDNHHCKLFTFDQTMICPHPAPKIPPGNCCGRLSAGCDNCRQTCRRLSTSLPTIVDKKIIRY